MTQAPATDRHPPSPPDQPIRRLQLGGTEVVLLGTAHVSRASAEAVARLLAEEDFDAVAVELCPSRYQALLDPNALERLDLVQVIRQGRASVVLANLALGAYQQRLADELGVEPGAEMKVAAHEARRRGLPVLLIDRDIGTTLRRVYRQAPWWRRMNLIGGLMGSVVSREKVDAEEIERLKEGDILENTFAQFAEEDRDLFRPLIEERDRYMVARLCQELAGAGYRKVLVVIGAGHLKGMSERLEQGCPDDPGTELAELERLPPPSRWPKRLPWLIVALVLAGFAVGFSRSPELGWAMVGDWVFINGGLAALGVLIARGHPLTVIAAFLAAPLTSLNPMVGAGMVTALVEGLIRRPSVGDFQRLRQDTAHLKGWWRNRVARTLLVFLFSTLGSAAGTYLAGFRIAERLLG